MNTKNKTEVCSYNYILIIVHFSMIDNVTTFVYCAGIIATFHCHREKSANSSWLTLLCQPRPSRSLEDFLYGFIHQACRIQPIWYGRLKLKQKFKRSLRVDPVFLREGTWGRSTVMSRHERSLYQTVFTYYLQRYMLTTRHI